MKKVYGVCSWCTREIVDPPFVEKKYPTINESELYHNQCFVIAHRALLVGVPDELIKDKQLPHRIIEEIGILGR